MAVPAEQIDRLDLCLNEVLANLLEHGGSKETGEPIQMRLYAITPDAGAGVRLEINEAEDGDGRPFGTEGCQRLLGTLHNAALPGILDALRSELHSFSQGRSLEDDCTLLLFRRT